ncbi:MAG: HlyD family efflux transporter periplasmic adaptor subunit [Thiogranum sp.]
METVNRELVQAWLDLQCSMVAGVTRAAVLIGSKPAAVWPRDSTVPASIMAAAQRAVIERRDVIDSMAMAVGAAVGQPSDVLAVPVTVDGRLFGVVSCEMSARSEAKQRAALQVLTWGIAWLELLARDWAGSAAGRLGIVVETIARAVAHDTFKASAIAVVNELARQLVCERVSIGFRDGQEMRVTAMSNTASLEERANLVRAVAAAMNEAVDQDKCVVLPAVENDPSVLVRAHEQLRTQFAAGAICSMPFSHNGEVLGALSFERNRKRPFDTHTLALCETVAAVVGPILQIKRDAHQPGLVKLRNAWRRQLAKLTGRGHLSLKTGVFAVAGLLLFLAFASGDYRIDAEAKLEGTVQRVVVAPFDGYIAEAPARAGDIVEQDQLLARLEDRDLKLEHAKWSGERAQLLKSQREALAKHERAEISILHAQREQAEAELALAEEKLARTQLKAPLAGIVVSGDLSQSLGAPIERGEVLFEVAPLNGYRIMLEIDERDIAHVQPGQRGELALSGLPHQRHVFSVERILPVSTARDGGNYFRVEARLTDPTDSLRPGMAGVGKIDAGERRLIWIWTHGLLDWLRLALWKWLG